MVREPFDFLTQPLGIESFDRLYNPSMMNTTLIVQEACVRDLVRQRVPKRVFDIGEETRLIEELRRLQLGESPPEIVVWQIADCRQQGDPHVLADGGRALEQTLFRGRQSIDASGDDHVDGGRDLNDGRIRHQLVPPGAAGQGPGLDQRPHALLQEERIPVGALDEDLFERLKRGIMAEPHIQQLPGDLRREWVNPQLRVITLPRPPVLMFGAVGNDE